MANLFGAIEYQRDHFWHEVVILDSLFYAHSNLYGSLFGVTNDANFEPLFAGRGLPNNASESLTKRYTQFASQFFGATWVSFNEISKIDWSQESLGFGYLTGEYVVEGEVKVTREEALEGTQFPLVVNLMQSLAEEFGKDNVRMVVFFD